MFEFLKRPIETYNKLWLATIGLTSIVAVILATVTLSRLSLGDTEYRAEFAQAASLRPGDQVTVAGIAVGTVRALALAGDHVVVRFIVRNEVRLGAQSKAAVKLTTLLGSRYLELSPAPTGKLSNRTIPLSLTTVPYDLQQTLADATTTFEQVDADRIAESIATLDRGLAGVPEALPQALASLKSISGVMAARRDQLHSLLAGADTVTTMVRSQQAALGSLILQGRDLLSEVDARRNSVHQLFAGVSTLIDRIRTILDDEPGVNAMINDAGDLLNKLHKNDALLRNTFQVMPVALRNAANSTGTGMATDAALPAGPFIDSWMCAISGRAKQFALPVYFNDCQPVPDPYPGFPPPYPQAAAFPGFPPDTLATAAVHPEPSAPATMPSPTATPDGVPHP